MTTKQIKKVINLFDKSHCKHTDCQKCDLHNLNMDARGMCECPLMTLKRVENKVNEQK